MKKITKIVLSFIVSGTLLLNTTVSYAHSMNSDSMAVANPLPVGTTAELLEFDTVPGEVLVTYEGTAEPVQLLSDIVENEISDISITSTEMIAEGIGEDEKDVVIFEVKDDRQTQELIDQLNEWDGVTAQPNYIYHTFESPETYQIQDDAIDAFAEVNDPSAGSQYYLNDYNEGGTNSGAGVYKAWDTAKVEKSITVAVLDTGCEINHPDLKDNIDTKHMWDAYNERSYMFDKNGHGTHVCGIVGAVADNGIGIAGASYNANVLPIKIFDDTGEGASTSDIIKAYKYLGGLIDSGELNDLHVVNMSVGGYGAISETDIALEQIISEFREDYNVLTVAAGGNGDENGRPVTSYCIPSDLDCVFSVTSLTKNGGNSYWSDYNMYKDISAPGENIYSTYLNNQYKNMSGTSMAAPLVSGIVALMFAAVPDADPDDVVDAIKSTAHSMAGKANDRGNRTGSAGAIDAAAAIAKLTDNIIEDDTKNDTEDDADNDEDDTKDDTEDDVDNDEDDTENDKDDVEDDADAETDKEQAGLYLKTDFYEFNLYQGQKQTIATPVIYTGDGVLQAVSDNESVATAYIEKGSLCISTGGEEGTATITVSASAGKHYLEAEPIKLKISAAYKITLIDEPIAAKNLIYNGKYQQGIPQGQGYELTGQTSAVNAGNYIAYATLKPGYQWRSGSAGNGGQRQLTWSIAKKPVVISANNISKTYGDKDPVLTASVSGVIAGETLNYSLERVKGEAVGNYAIRVVEGNNPNYRITFKTAVFTIHAVAQTSDSSLPKVDSTYQIGKLVYRVTSSTKSMKRVSVIKPVKKTEKKITIPATVKIDGYTYKVTQIDNKAFYKNKRLTQVVIGKNVTKIGKQAFLSSSKLKKVDIKADKLSTIGTQAFAKISKKAKIYVPKKKLKAYKTKLKKAKTIKSAQILKI